MKKDLILLHGALGAKTQFKTLKQVLEKEFNVYDFNFSGHGGSSCPEEFSMDLFSNNLKGFILSNQLYQPDIFGYSMGGYVTLNLVKSSPELVGKIMTLASKLSWSPEIAKKEIKLLNPDIIAEKVPAFAQQLKERHHPEDWKTVLDKTAKLMHGLGNGSALQLNDFKTISNKVLMLIGDKDVMVTVEETKNVADVIPNAELRILEGIQHPIEKVDIDLLGTLISDFFD